MINRRAATVLAATSATALALSSCAGSDREGGSSDSASDTLTFGAAGAPAMFDPFYGTDGETFRPARQMFETLVDFKPGTAELAPGLATKWTESNGGKTWTFDLRTGVKFTDGTAFNAEAVCKNFTRMFDQNEAGQTAGSYWADNMGFKGGDETPLYKGCTAKGANQAVIEVTRATSKFPDLLGLPSFSMQSPTALEKYNANKITPQGDGFTYSEYALKHPTGTGKYKLEKYDEANKSITLVRNDDYWGDKAKTAKLVFKIIPDETQRKNALAAGDIDGYDLPNPVDWPTLKKDDNLLIRPAFNILYLGLNPNANPALKDIKVRQALYYAMNRPEFVKSQLPEGATVATQFVPSTVDGYNKDIAAYGYDPTKAKQLLKEAGQENLEIKLWYPSEVTRPYMPDPQKVFQSVKSDWEKVGIKVTPVTRPWNGGYLTATDQGKADSFFLGWTGDYNTTDNFIANFFGSPGGAFGVDGYTFGKTLLSEIQKADGVVDPAERTKTYQQLNAKIMKDYLVGLPISSSPPAIVFSKKVSGVVASPLTAEDFGTAVKK
ncbi:ABC transporter substrate-binding protein [Dermacoccaceae bacterium W4C1]